MSTPVLPVATEKWMSGGGVSDGGHGDDGTVHRTCSYPNY